MYQEISLKTENLVYTNTRSDKADLDYHMHCHNCFELYYLITGNVEFYLDGTKTRPKPGTLLAIAPDVFHGVRALDGQMYHRIRLHFTEHQLAEGDAQLLLKTFQGGMHYLEEQFGIEWYFHAVEQCREYEKELQEIAIRTGLTLLLSRISAISRKDPSRRRVKPSKVQEVIAYINEHLSERLTLEAIARDFFISKNHLTDIFKQATGTTVANYILCKRMALVRRELALGTPTAVAAERAGFGDYSSFFRAYKKLFGYAPSERKGLELAEEDREEAF